MSSAAQRSELQSQIWKIANDVRGSVDGWDFKQYVLVTLFYRFISENFTNYIEGGDDSVSKSVDNDKIAEENYNLSVSSYVEAKDTREKIDIVKLNAEIKEIVAREQMLRDEIDKIIAEIEVG